MIHQDTTLKHRTTASRDYYLEKEIITMAHNATQGTTIHTAELTRIHLTPIRGLNMEIQATTKTARTINGRASKIILIGWNTRCTVTPIPRTRNMTTTIHPADCHIQNAAT